MLQSKPEVRPLRGARIEYYEQLGIIFGQSNCLARGSEVVTLDDSSGYSDLESSRAASTDVTQGSKRKRSAGQDPKKEKKKKHKTGQEHLADAVVKMAAALSGDPNTHIIDEAIELLDGQYSRLK